LAEILGRDTGLNRGRGGTIHLSDPDRGFVQTSGIVGGAVGLAVGAGYACKQKGEGAVTAAFFGDGSLEEGLSFEALNIASLWKLPVIFICENNSADAWGTAKGGFPTLVHAADDLRSIPGSMGIEAMRVDGTDPFAVHDAVHLAAERCRAGTGPIFIEAMTRRWAGSAPLWPELATGITDIGMATGEIAIVDGPHRAWFETNDPLLRLARELAAAGSQAKARLHQIDKAVSARIRDAVDFATGSPFPAEDSAQRYVFA
jgi:pyruvate dehydrogenase E1 component alpha subunit